MAGARRVQSGQGHVPGDRFTKGQLIEYYSLIAPVMLPHVRDRPLTMKRYPDGVDGPSFFEKHAPSHAPDWVRHVSVPASDGGTAVDYSVICDLADLVWAANLATIEFHVPLWRVGRRRKLPPRPITWCSTSTPVTVPPSSSAARWRWPSPSCSTPGTSTSYAKTSGSKGLQLYVPVGKPLDVGAGPRDAHQVATQLEQDRPELVVSNMRKELRRNKVLIDWGQNHPAKTTVAAYSLRARPEPTVSTPVTWEEVGRCADEGDAGLLRFTAPDVLDRVDAHGRPLRPGEPHTLRRPLRRDGRPPAVTTTMPHSPCCAGPTAAPPSSGADRLRRRPHQVLTSSGADLIRC